MKDLDRFLREGNVVFFEYQGKRLPDFISSGRKGVVKFFTKKACDARAPEMATITRHYETLSEIREQRADIYFLDRRATRVLFAEFPATARYVLIRLVPRFDWIVAIPGVLRRLYNKSLTAEGIATIPGAGNLERWLVLRHEIADTLHARLSLSEDIGVQKFLDYLRAEEVRYVILRFYNKLPKLYREGGDLDVLVADEDEHKIRGFLQKHPGSIGVDLWTVSRTTHNSVTYYPPPLAKKIITSRIEGPAGSYIPAPREAFLGLIYHTLYHKGAFAGVPSELPGVKINQHPENDYAGVLKNMAEGLGVDVAITMEALDEYLSKEGWQPKLDTLAKIAPRNKWVWKRFFSVEESKEIGLGVFILKEKALVRGLAGAILETIHNHEGFRVVRIKRFNEGEVRHVSDHLRGGVWDDASGSARDFLPAMAVVVLDAYSAHSLHPKTMRTGTEKRMRELKRTLRRKFDDGRVSLIHSTDNSSEAWEYIAECFADEINDVKEEIEHVYGFSRPPLPDRVIARLLSIPRYVMYRFAVYKQSAKNFIVRWVLG